jgi:SulP family sulfate permease
VEIFMDAVAIALLGGIESLLSAVIGDGMMGGRHKSNCELVGQGIANIGSILFGGIPATGAIARTATNVKSGAQTPVAGMIHALTLLLIVLFFSPLVSHIPLSALAAVLIMIAWNMSEVSHFLHLLKAPLGDVVILLTTFFLTLFVDITAAITLGMILSSFLFMKRMSQFSKVQLSSAFHESKVEFPEKKDPDLRKYLAKGVEIYEIQGPFFFGTADMLKDLLVNMEPAPKVFILRLRLASFIDASGMCALKEFHERCKKEGTSLFLAEVEGHVKADLKKFGLMQLIGKKQIFPSLDLALAAALR